MLAVSCSHLDPLQTSQWFAERDVMEFSLYSSDYSALMLAARVTFRRRMVDHGLPRQHWELTNCAED
jgi:hypothetical protein